MIVLVARYYAQAGQGDTIEAALKQMGQRVAADEPECKLYLPNRSQEHPDQFLMYEHYADEAALLAHRETPHFKEFIEGTVVPLLERREREVYTLIA